MRRLGIFFVTLFAVCLFAIPAYATTAVDITVPNLQVLIEPAAVTDTATAADLDLGYVETLDNASTWGIQSNVAWTLTTTRTAFSGTLTTQPTTLQFMSDGFGGSFSSFVTIPEGSTAIGSGSAGEDNTANDEDWRVSTINWASGTGTAGTVVTWTLSAT